MNRRGFLSGMSAVIGTAVLGITAQSKINLDNISAPCFCEMFLGDGIEYMFEMTYRAYNLSVLEDGIEKRIGLKFMTEPIFHVDYYLDYYLDYYNKMIERIAGPLPSGVILECRYAIRLNEKLRNELLL